MEIHNLYPIVPKLYKLSSFSPCFRQAIYDAFDRFLQKYAV